MSMRVIKIFLNYYLYEKNIIITFFFNFYIRYS